MPTYLAVLDAMRKMKTHKGFTLVEMAVVLVIVGLMLGGMMIPLSAQMDRQKAFETKKRMEEIKEALIGFAILHGRFPCPSTVVDPSNAGFGVEDAVCPPATAPTQDGYLPWKTLGVAETDGWGVTQASATGGMVGYWRYRVDRNYFGLFNLGTAFATDALKVQDSAGNSLTTTTERPVVIVISSGKDNALNGENADYEDASGVYQSDVLAPAFDDFTMWISRPLLFNRLIASGRLP